MEQPNYMDKIELLKSQSDLESLKNRISDYSSKVNVSDDSEYKEINGVLDSYLQQIKNGIEVKAEDIALIKTRWNRFMVGHAYTSFWTARVLATIVAAVIITPLFYYTYRIKPGYELIIIILGIILLIYLVARSKRN
jgi:uncharacterized membrane protein